MKLLKHAPRISRAGFGSALAAPFAALRKWRGNNVLPQRNMEFRRRLSYTAWTPNARGEGKPSEGASAESPEPMSPELLPDLEECILKLLKKVHPDLHAKNETHKEVNSDNLAKLIALLDSLNDDLLEVENSDTGLTILEFFMLQRSPEANEDAEQSADHIKVEIMVSSTDSNSLVVRSQVYRGLCILFEKANIAEEFRWGKKYHHGNNPTLEQIRSQEGFPNQRHQGFSAADMAQDEAAVTEDIFAEYSRSTNFTPGSQPRDHFPGFDEVFSVNEFMVSVRQAAMSTLQMTTRTRVECHVMSTRLRLHKIRLVFEGRELGSTRYSKQLSALLRLHELFLKSPHFTMHLPSKAPPSTGSRVGSQDMDESVMNPMFQSMDSDPDSFSGFSSSPQPNAPLSSEPFMQSPFFESINSLREDTEDTQESPLSGRVLVLSSDAPGGTGLGRASGVDSRGRVMLNLHDADEAWLQLLEDPATFEYAEERESALRQIQDLELQVAATCGLYHVFSEPGLGGHPMYLKFLNSLIDQAHCFADLPLKFQPSASSAVPQDTSVYYHPDSSVESVSSPSHPSYHTGYNRAELEKQSANKQAEARKREKVVLRVTASGSITVDVKMGFINVPCSVSPGEIRAFLLQEGSTAATIRSSSSERDNRYDEMLLGTKRKLQLRSLTHEAYMARHQILECCTRLLTCPPRVRELFHGIPLHLGGTYHFDPEDGVVSIPVDFFITYDGVE